MYFRKENLLSDNTHEIVPIAATGKAQWSAFMDISKTKATMANVIDILAVSCSQLMLCFCLMRLPLHAVLDSRG
jgi:hypothetical protein